MQISGGVRAQTNGGRYAEAMATVLKTNFLRFFTGFCLMQLHDLRGLPTPGMKTLRAFT